MKFENLVILESDSIRNALVLLEKSGKKLLLATDELNRVKGVLTDGDIRRGLLNGEVLDNLISNIMTKDFFYVEDGKFTADIKHKSLKLGIEGIPVLDSEKKLLDILWNNTRFKRKEYENQVIIMAGGKGKRLYPLTEEVPKPMIEINGTPMIHHLISRMKNQGFYKFIICVNYKKEQIKDYLGDGSGFDIEISYTEEKKPLGTAGSLSLIPPLEKPSILVNADLITNIDFKELLIQNQNNKSNLIIVTKNEKISVPYGVVDTQGSKVLEIKEKPNFDFLINTGIYLITEEVRKLVKKNKYLDMPDLTNLCLKNKCKVEHFLCTDNWLDIGRFETLKKAQDFLD